MTVRRLAIRLLPCVLAALALIALPIAGAEDAPEADAPKSANPFADITDIAELEAEVARIAEEKSALSARLQEIALDDTQGVSGAVERRAAIDALAKLGDDESLDFLARNLELKVAPPPDFFSFTPSFGDFNPCLDALTAAGWKAIPAILRHLQHHEKPAEGEVDVPLLYSRILLSQQFGGTEPAAAFVEVQLDRATDEPHRENLQRLLWSLRNPHRRPEP